MGRSRNRKRAANAADSQSKKIKENKWDESPRHYKEIVKENEEFETFYKMQKIVPESDWPAFMSSMRESLPMSFRITGSRSEAQALLAVIKKEFFKNCLNTTDGDSSTKIHPVCLPWYPDELAWQLQLTRKDIRGSEEYNLLHNFLIAETSCGNISRQETVSMIPPLVLDVQSHHKVLDMCAAPGSKTAQLIEALHKDTKTFPTGLVIANDIDNNRCYMLVHQAKRLNSPCTIITNHDSSVMPNFLTGPDQVMKFDRVLCDVPCSGDGTMRKNPDIWMKWNSANGTNLHGVQARIVRRGLEMLAVGGRLVYSTCSLNPVENEAVIHRLLKETKGSTRLVDVSHQLPGLKYEQGMSHWRPASRDLIGYDSFEEVPEKYHTQVRPQMFPPSPEDRDKYRLDKCIRILPHHQDTGAFFVAVLEKVGALPWEGSARTEVPVPTETEENKNGAGESKEGTEEAKNGTEESKEGTEEAKNGTEESKEGTEDSKNGTEESKEGTEPTERAPWGPQRKRRRVGGYKEDPFVFFTETEEVWPDIKNFYDIGSPLDPTCLLTRCKEGKKKNIYVTSPAVRDVVARNQDRIKFINTGVKAFARCDNKSALGAGCAFRLAQEGLDSVLPFFGPRRRLDVTLEDLVHLLTNDDPKHPPEFTTLDPSTQEKLKSLSTGSCVLLYRMTESLTLYMVGWKGTMSVRAYIPVNDAVHYLRLVGADVTKFVKNKFQARKEKKEEGEKEEEEKEEETIEEEKDVV